MNKVEVAAVVEPAGADSVVRRASCRLGSYGGCLRIDIIFDSEQQYGCLARSGCLPGVDTIGALQPG